MKTLGIIMNGVTGRMGTNQHLIRSILAIREQGGVLLSNGENSIDYTIKGRMVWDLCRLGKIDEIS